MRRLVPEFVLSFLDMNNVLTLLASVGTDFPVCISERIDPKSHNIHWVKKYCRDWMYRFADRIIVQTDRIKAGLPNFAQSNSLVIPNPINVLPAPITYQQKTMIAVGRLELQKTLIY